MYLWNAFCSCERVHVSNGPRLALIGLALCGLPACDGGDDAVTGQSASPPPGESPESEPGTPGTSGASGSGGAVRCEGLACDAPSGAFAGSGGQSSSPAAPGGAPGDNAPGTGTEGSATPASGPGTGSAPAGPLPDLVLDAAYLLDTTVEDTVQTDDVCLLNEGCVTGLGERRIVRFGSRTGNLGTAPLLLGRPAEGTPYWTFDSCHETYDMFGFARYELLAADTGSLVLTGTKSNFCLRDSEPWALEGGASCFAYTYDCTNQGITPGCADNYGSELACQWVDITDVPAGAYTLRVTVNASRSIAELDYANNVVEVSLEIADDAVRVQR
jgi:hypothetical protein